MYVTRHKYYGDEVVIRDLDWYMKISSKLYDRRNNNNYLIIRRINCETYTNNIKKCWAIGTRILKKWLDDIVIDIKDANSKKVEYISDILTDEIDKKFYHGGLTISINLSLVTLYDYEVYKGVEPIYEGSEDQLFDGIISIFFNFPEKELCSIRIGNFFELSNFLKKIDEMAIFAENIMYSISEIKQSEKTYFEEVVHYCNDNDILKLYFDKYQSFDDNNISFEKSRVEVETSNEHGSSRYEDW